MGDLSNNFSRWEFACFDGCGFDTADIETVDRLEILRDHFGGARVIITPKGGCRCVTVNAAAGGANDSKHLEGRAADIVVVGFHPKIVHRYLVMAYPKRYGIGLYEWGVHFDTASGGPRRWGIKNDLLS